MATAAAAVVAKARQTVIDHLMTANATSPEAAVLYDPVRRLERRQLGRLCDRGVCHRTAESRYWIDLPAYVAWHRRMRQWVVLSLLALAVVLLAVALLVPR